MVEPRKAKFENWLEACDICGREIDFEGGEPYYQSETVKTMCEKCYLEERAIQE